MVKGAVECFRSRGSVPNASPRLSSRCPSRCPSPPADVAMTRGAPKRTPFQRPPTPWPGLRPNSIDLGRATERIQAMRGVLTERLPARVKRGYVHAPVGRRRHQRSAQRSHSAMPGASEPPARRGASKLHRGSRRADRLRRKAGGHFQLRERNRCVVCKLLDRRQGRSQQRQASRECEKDLRCLRR